MICRSGQPVQPTEALSGLWDPCAPVRRTDPFFDPARAPLHSLDAPAGVRRPSQAVDGGPP